MHTPGPADGKELGDWLVWVGAELGMKVECVVGGKLGLELGDSVG